MAASSPAQPHDLYPERWPHGVEPAIKMCIDPHGWSKSIDVWVIQQLVDAQYLTSRPHKATHILLDPEILVTNEELDGYAKTGGVVVSFDWAIDSVRDKIDNKTEVDYVIKKEPEAEPASVKVEPKAEDAEDEVVALAPAPVGRAATAEPAPAIKAEETGETIFEAGTEARNSPSAASLSSKLGSEPEEEQEPARTSRTASRGKGRATLEDAADESDPSDAEEEQDDEDEFRSSPQPVQKARPKSQKASSSSDKKQRPSELNVAPTVAHDLVLPVPDKVKKKGNKEAWEAVMRLRPDGLIDLGEYPLPRTRFGENCRSDAFALSLNDGIFDLLEAPDYPSDKPITRRRAGWSKREDRYLIHLWARSDPTLEADDRAWSDQWQTIFFMFCAAFPLRQMGGTGMRMRGNGGARRPFFDAAIALERSMPDHPLPPLPPNPFRYPELGTPLSTEDNAKLARLFIALSHKMDELVGVQTFMTRAFGVLDNTRRYDEIFDAWEFVWYQLYPEKTPAGLRKYGSDPHGYKDEAPPASAKKRTATRGTSASSSATLSAGSASRRLSSSREEDEAGPSKRARMDGED